MIGSKDNYQTRNVVVTGGAGYIGSVLVPYLLNVGYRVYVIDDLRYGGHGLLGVWEHPRLLVFEHDIRDQNYLFHLLQGVDVVVHLAAIVGKPACFEDEHETWAINYGATCYLLEAAKGLGVDQFIFASTCSNYGRCDLATEESPLNPLELYAQTKVEAEKQVLSSKIPTTTVLRLATAYGVSPRMRFDLLLNEFVRDALGAGLLVYGKESWRPLVHVYDIARAIGLCIEKKAHGIFNVGGHNRQKQDIVETLRHVYPEMKVKYKESREDPRDYQVSFDKISKLGLTPSYNPEDSITAISSALISGVFVDPYGIGYRND